MNYGNRVYPTVASTATRVIEIEEGMFKRWEEGRMVTTRHLQRHKKAKTLEANPPSLPMLGRHGARRSILLT
jgi:uncharacterized protein YfdQ (DUF2303 family)